MLDTIEAQFDAVIELSREMVKSSLDEDWEHVIELEARRDELIKRLFAPSVRMSRDLAAGKIQVLQDLNQQLIVYGQRHREALGKELLKLARGLKSVRFYQE